MTDIIIKDFEKIADKIISAAEEYHFYLNELPEINEYKTDIRTYGDFTKIFESLNQKLNNCIYWFESESNENTFNLNSILNMNRINLIENKRVVPVVNKNSDSNILYVGIRRGGIRKYDGLTNISGRVIQHLGYYKKGSTQGLQLAHWAKTENIKITIKVVEFNLIPNEYLEMLEKLVARRLKPLCGKH